MATIFLGLVLIISLVGLAALIMLRRKQRSRTATRAPQRDLDQTLRATSPAPEESGGRARKLTQRFTHRNKDQAPSAPVLGLPQPGVDPVLGSGAGAMSLGEAMNPVASSGNNPSGEPAAVPVPSGSQSAAARAANLPTVRRINAGPTEAGAPEAGAASPGEGAASSAPPAPTPPEAGQTQGQGPDPERLDDALRGLFKTDAIVDPNMVTLLGRVQPLDISTLAEEIQALKRIIRAQEQANSPR